MESIAQGISLLEQGHVDAAISVCEKLVEDPNQKADALHLLGVAFAHQGEAEQAVSFMNDAVMADPSNYERRFNLGLLALETGQPELAWPHLQAVVHQDPQNADALACLGNAFSQVGRHQEAVDTHEKAIHACPSSGPLWSNLASAYLAWGKIEAGEAGATMALKYQPESAELVHNLGRAQLLGNKLEDAQENFLEALRIDPEHVKARCNYAVTLRRQGRYAQAQDELEECLRLDPNYFEAEWNLSLVELSRGDWKAGWQHYEARRSMEPRVKKERCGQVWNGELRPEDTLYIDAEQGLGDTIQFLRYISAAKARVDQVILRVQPKLIPLLKSCFHGADCIEALPERPTDELWAPLMSLPHLLQTGADLLAKEAPYLKVSAEQQMAWTDRLTAEQPLKIGIAWQGNPAYGCDQDRSIPLEQLTPLLEMDGVSFYSLQKYHGTEQIKALPADIQLENFESELDENGAFVDTAAILPQLDLVICSDSAIAHLAGALGVPCYLMLSKTPDWRWAHPSAQWYPNMRFYGQAQAGNWISVAEQIKEDLINP